MNKNFISFKSLGITFIQDTRTKQVKRLDTFYSFFVLFKPLFKNASSFLKVPSVGERPDFRVESISKALHMRTQLSTFQRQKPELCIRINVKRTRHASTTWLSCREECIIIITRIRRTHFLPTFNHNRLHFVYGGPPLFSHHKMDKLPQIKFKISTTNIP